MCIRWKCIFKKCLWPFVVKYREVEIPGISSSVDGKIWRQIWWQSWQCVASPGPMPGLGPVPCCLVLNMVIFRCRWRDGHGDTASPAHTHTHTRKTQSLEQYISFGDIKQDVQVKYIKLECCRGNLLGWGTSLHETIHPDMGCTAVAKPKYQVFVTSLSSLELLIQTKNSLWLYRYMRHLGLTNQNT